MVPVAKGRVRLSPRTGGIYTPSKTRDAQDAIQELAALCHDEPLSGPLCGQFVFVYASPKVKNTRIEKLTKPDLTNLVKLVEDALLPRRDRDTGFPLWDGTYHDDAQIVWEETAKLYCWAPHVKRGVYVRLAEMDEADQDLLIDWAESVISACEETE